MVMLTERSALSLIASYIMVLTVPMKHRPYLALTNLTFDIITKLGQANDSTAAHYTPRAALIKDVENIVPYRSGLSLIASYIMFLTVPAKHRPYLALTNLTFDIITQLGQANDSTVAHYTPRAVLIKDVENIFIALCITINSAFSLAITHVIRVYLVSLIILS